VLERAQLIVRKINRSSTTSETLMPEFMADMLKDALAAADDHLRIAREKLFEAQNALEMLRATEGHLVITEIIKEAIPAMVDDENQEQQLLQETRASGLTSILTGLALLVTLIVLAVLWYVKH
jgi:hypothetical protein